MSQAAWSYDAIAKVYATDMGQSMPFDDIGYYRRVVGARVLELGCGTGRILLPLLRAGIEAVGVDRSLPMLQQLRRDGADLSPSVAQMDLRALALHGRFDWILAPYSLITYLTEPAELSGLLSTLRGLLADGGQVLLDAFVPRDVTSFEDFRLDYRRPHQDGTLERAKRIRQLADGCNRIERRYRLLDANDRLIDEFHTVDQIRPYPPSALRALLQASGFRIQREDWDYGSSQQADSARFFSVSASLA